jgi:4-alpha-methyl-delta7-sterol-4alpha-methyl oxidase
MLGFMAEVVRDPMFWWFPVGATVVSMTAFVAFAVPLTALAWFEPAWAAPWRIQPRRPDVRKWLRQAIDRWLFNNLLLTIAVVALWPLVAPWSRVHLGEPPPWWWMLAQVVGFVYLDDVLYYFMHRAMHHPRVYRHVHAVHHRVRTPVAITGHFMHPIEYGLTGLLALVGPLLVGAHVYTLYAWVALRQWEAAEGHCGYNLPFSPVHLLPGSDAGVFHDFHHAHFQGNYAGFLAWFDRVMGTEVPEYTADRERRERG